MAANAATRFIAGPSLLFRAYVVENLHDLHWNTSVSSPNTRLILWRKVIVCPQTGQMTSVGGAASLLIVN